jgi:hypothetical protein
MGLSCGSRNEQVAAFITAAGVPRSMSGQCTVLTAPRPRLNAWMTCVAEGKPVSRASDGWPSLPGIPASPELALRDPIIVAIPILIEMVICSRIGTIRFVNNLQMAGA